MKSTFDAEAIGALGFDAMNVFGVRVDRPRVALDAPRIEVPRPDSVNRRLFLQWWCCYLLRPVLYHSPSLSLQSCPIAVLEEVLWLRVSLKRMKRLGHVLEVGKVGLPPCYLDLESWEESWIGRGMRLHRARAQTWLLPLVGLMRVERTEHQNEGLESFGIFSRQCRVVDDQ